MYSFAKYCWVRWLLISFAPHVFKHQLVSCFSVVALKKDRSDENTSCICRRPSYYIDFVISNSTEWYGKHDWIHRWRYSHGLIAWSILCSHWSAECQTGLSSAWIPFKYNDKYSCWYYIVTVIIIHTATIWLSKHSKQELI